MVKMVFQTLVLSFFRASAPAVLRTYETLIHSIDRSLFPDYRIALSTIIGKTLTHMTNHIQLVQLDLIQLTRYIS